MANGINFGSFGKSSNSKTKSTGKSTGKTTGKGKVGPSYDPIQIINGGMNIVSELTRLFTTIGEQKQKTAQEKERTHQIKIESDERLDTLKTKLNFETEKMRQELEKYKCDTQVRIKDSEKDKVIQLKNIGVRELEIKNEHIRNMRMIDQQEKTLDVALELYTLYYTKKINGEYVGIDDPTDIVNNLSNCIKSMRTYIQALNAPKNYVDAEIIEE